MKTEEGPIEGLEKSFEDKSGFSKVLTGRTSADDILRKELGPDFATYREIWDKASNQEIVTDFPTHVGFELNHSCNLKCPMCPWSSQEAKKIEGKKSWFDIETFKQVIDEGVPKGLKSLSMNWVNEPLVRRDLPDFIAYARQKGVLDVFVHTNAVLLTRDISDRLIDAGLTRLSVSLDAFNEETYNQIRIGSDFDLVKKNIFQFLDIRAQKESALPVFGVSFVRMSTNESELEDFRKYWGPKVDFLTVQEYTNPFPELGEAESVDLNRYDEKEWKFHCAMPFQRVSISNDMKVMPCCVFFGEDISLGNLKDQTVGELWNSDKMNELREMHIKGEFWKNETCHRCAKATFIEKNNLSPTSPLIAKG